MNYQPQQCTIGESLIITIHLHCLIHPNWLFPKIGVAQNRWFISRKTLLKWDYFRVFHLFLVQHPKWVPFNDAQSSHRHNWSPQVAMAMKGYCIAAVGICMAWSQQSWGFSKCKPVDQQTLPCVFWAIYYRSLTQFKAILEGIPSLNHHLGWPRLRSL